MVISTHVINSKLFTTQLLIVGLFSPISIKTEVYNVLFDISQSITSNDD